MVSKGKSKRRTLLAVVGILGLAACAAPPTAETEASPAPAPTLTPSPTVASTPTFAPTSTPPLPTPDFLDSPVAGMYLLAPSEDPACQLPCWQGLRVGESNREDIQAMFDRVFGFNGTLDFFAASPIPANSINPFDLEIPGTQATGYIWLTEYNGYYPYYEVDPVVDKETGILQGIRFLYDPGMTVSEEGAITDSGYYRLHTPQQIIRTMGSPDYVFARLVGGAVEFSLIYKEGVASFSTIIAPGEQRVVNGQAGTYGDFCLDAQSWVMDEYIVGSFNDLNDVDSLTPIQKKWIVDIIEGTSVVPVEEALGVTIERITEVALQDENPCITISY